MICINRLLLNSLLIVVHFQVAGSNAKKRLRRYFLPTEQKNKKNMDRIKLSAHNTEYVYSSDPVNLFGEARTNYFTCRGMHK